MRRLLQTEESLQWIETGRDDVLAFRRPNGWTVVTNFGQTPHALPADGARSLSSRHFEGDELPPETTVWLTGA
jgi:alpha-glucosidase